MTRVRWDWDVGSRSNCGWQARRPGGGAGSPEAGFTAAGGGKLAGLRRNRPSGHGFERWLVWERERETGNASRGSGGQGRGWTGAHDSERRNGGDGERLPPREVVREWEKRSSSFLTTTRSSWGVRTRWGSGGTAARQAAPRSELQWRQRS